MKKFVGLVLVFCLAATASAVDIHGLRVVDAKDHYTPSEWITIELFLDLYSGELANSFVMDVVQDNGPNAGQAASPAADSRWTSGYGGDLGAGHDLVYFASGAIIYPDPDIEGVLWSMEYHVPEAPESTYIDITALHDPGAFWFSEISISGTGGSYSVPIDGVTIHIIPEPMTVVLLGLGGLVALRRRRR